VRHPKDVGDGSTLAIMTALRMSGVALYVPFGENTRCDLIVDEDGELIRVQCKTGRLRDGAIRFAVCSCYGHHRNPETARRNYQGQVDYFAVYCTETPRNNQRKRIRFARDYQIARVTTEGLRASSGA